MQDKKIDAILSVHPEYAEAIVSGKKTVEFRRRSTTLAIGTRIWIYATRPLGAIVGVAVLKAIHVGHPLGIWRKHHLSGRIPYSDYQAYFASSKSAVAMELENSERTASVSLERLRKIRPGFHPPQTILRLTAAEALVLDTLS